MTPERCEICGTNFCPRKWGKAGDLWKDDMITCYRLGYERASAALRERDALHAKSLDVIRADYKKAFEVSDALGVGGLYFPPEAAVRLRALLEEAGK